MCCYIFSCMIYWLKCFSIAYEPIFSAQALGKFYQARVLKGRVDSANDHPWVCCWTYGNSPGSTMLQSLCSPRSISHTQNMQHTVRILMICFLLASHGRPMLSFFIAGMSFSVACNILWPWLFGWQFRYVWLSTPTSGDDFDLPHVLGMAWRP